MTRTLATLLLLCGCAATEPAVDDPKPVEVSRPTCTTDADCAEGSTCVELFCVGGTGEPLPAAHSSEPCWLASDDRIVEPPALGAGENCRTKAELDAECAKGDEEACQGAARFGGEQP